MPIHGPLETRRLIWPEPLDIDRAAHVIRQRATDPSSPRLVLEAWGFAGQVHYQVVGERHVLDRLGRELVAGRLITSTAPRPVVTAAAQLVVSGGQSAPLSVERAAETAHALLGALSDGRRAWSVLQIILGRPRRPLRTTVPRSNSRAAPWANTAVPTAEQRRESRAKTGQHGFECVIRLGIAETTAGQARGRFSAMLAALRLLEAPGVHLSLRRSSPKRLNEVRSPWLWPLQLNVTEIAALTGWPIGDPPFAGLPPVHPKRLVSNPHVATSGRVIGDGEPSGSQTRPLALTSQDSMQHLHVLGPTGTGKSTLLLNLAVQDMADGRGLVVIDPKGDLVSDLLRRVPPSREEDVVLIDATDSTPTGLNPLRAPGRSAEAAADGVLAVFRALYADAWGPRTNDILHACLLTLTRHPSASLVMVPLLLSNDGFRRSLTSNVSREDPWGLGSFWAWYEATSDAEKASAVAPLMNKLRSVLLRPGLRAVLGQTNPRFTISDVFTQRRILLVNLAKGSLGPEASALLGSLVVAQLWQGTLARAAVSPQQRHAAMVYVDEVQDYLHLPTDLADALAQARSLGVGFTLAHQFLAQLPPSMRAAFLANARSRVYFQLPHDDAVVAARGHAEVTPDDFTSLGVHQTYVSLLANGNVTPYAFATTRPPAPPTSDAERVRRSSRERYGRPLSEVEASWQALADNSDSAEPNLGRRPRRTS